MRLYAARYNGVAFILTYSRATLKMSNAAGESDVPPSSDVQFSIRTLLFITVPMALIAAAMGSYVRTLDKVEQFRVAIAWMGWIAIVAAWIVCVAWKRIRVENLAGRTLVRLPIYGVNPHWRQVNLFLLSGPLALLAVANLFSIAHLAIGTGSIVGTLLAALYSIFVAWMTAECVALWWWSNDIRLSEEGVLWDMRLIRWRDVREQWHPDHDVLMLCGRDQDNVELRCEVIVPQEQREAVDAVLNEKLGTNARLPRDGGPD